MTLNPYLIILSAISLLLSGCASDEELKSRRQAQLNADIMEASSRCQAMGFKKNSDQMNLCVMTTVQTIAEERALAFQRSQAAWASIKAAGEALHGPPSYSTSCNRFGNQINCTTR